MILAAILSAALPAQAAGLKGVKGRDDRVEAPAKSFPWSAVGRLNNGMGGHCSGMLIGPNLVVTAAHCLWNKKTRRPMPAQSMKFVAGYDRGSYLAFSQVERVVIAPQWQFGVPYGPGPASQDWALLILAENLGEQAGWAALGPDPTPADKIAAVGYGQDKAHIPAVHLGCTASGKLSSGVLTHDCDAVHGDSGGPILTLVDGMPRLSAIHVATFTMSDGRVLGGAVGASQFAAEARKQGAASSSKAGALSQPDGGALIDRLK